MIQGIVKFYKEWAAYLLPLLIAFGVIVVLQIFQRDAALRERADMYEQKYREEVKQHREMTAEYLKRMEGMNELLQDLYSEQERLMNDNQKIRRINERLLSDYNAARLELRNRPRY